MSARVAAVIPARHASVRLPGKPLLAATGKPLIQHVHERVAAARGIETVIVATDDERIRKAVAGFGGQARMTSSRHPSGTDRVAEVARDLDHDVILNVQGDEPEIAVEALERLVELVRAHPQVAAATLAISLEPDLAADPAAVKVVLDVDSCALYFSRSPIPHPRNPGVPFLLHVGVYGFRRAALLEFAATAPTPLERTEGLEQLRFLETGRRIKVGVLEGTGWGGIDTEEDYRRFVDRFNRTSS